MGKAQRINKKLRRVMANMEGYQRRFNKALDDHDRHEKSDAHMQHRWLTEWKLGKGIYKPARKPAPFHNGRKR